MKKKLNSLKSNLINSNKLIVPVLKQKNIIKLYFYRFVGSRWEQATLIGEISKVTKRKSVLESTTITIKKKMYGMFVEQTINLNNSNLIGVRVIR